MTVNRRASLLFLILTLLGCSSAGQANTGLSPDVKILKTMQDLETLRSAILIYVAKQSELPGSLSDLVTAGFLREVPAIAINDCRDVIIVDEDEMPEQPRNDKGAWYYNRKTGEVRVGITGPNGPVPLSRFLPGFERQVNPWLW